MGFQPYFCALDQAVYFWHEDESWDVDRLGDNALLSLQSAQMAGMDTYIASYKVPSNLPDGVVRVDAGVFYPAWAFKEAISKGIDISMMADTIRCSLVLFLFHLDPEGAPIKTGDQFEEVYVQNRPRRADFCWYQDLDHWWLGAARPSYIAFGLSSSCLGIVVCTVPGRGGSVGMTFKEKMHKGLMGYFQENRQICHPVMFARFSSDVVLQLGKRMDEYIKRQVQVSNGRLVTFAERQYWMEGIVSMLKHHGLRDSTADPRASGLCYEFAQRVVNEVPPKNTLKEALRVCLASAVVTSGYWCSTAKNKANSMYTLGAFSHVKPGSAIAQLKEHVSSL